MLVLGNSTGSCDSHPFEACHILAAQFSGSLWLACANPLHMVVWMREGRHFLVGAKMTCSGLSTYFLHLNWKQGLVPSDGPSGIQSDGGMPGDVVGGHCVLPG